MSTSRSFAVGYFDPMLVWKRGIKCRESATLLSRHRSLTLTTEYERTVNETGESGVNQVHVENGTILVNCFFLAN